MNNIFFYFEKIDKKNYFISNDSGKSLIITGKEFNQIKKGKISKKLQKKLQDNNFIINKNTIINFIKNTKTINEHTFSPPSLHIIVMTLQCNHFCQYCRATTSNFKNTEISEKTFKKTIDFIFKTPNKNITIEFQGGEPLISWEKLKNAILYAENLNKKYNKNLIITIVTNLSLMDKEKLKFIIEHKISLCTSLDGPKEIHDKNRIYHKTSSYDKVSYWLKMINILTKKFNKGDSDSLPSALMTTTKFSLPYYKEIIDEYRKLNLGGIFLRPLSPIGYAKNIWNKIGYTADEFLKFYEKSIDYIIEINRKGEKFIERNAAIKLKKILLNQNPNYLDLRSPCGAAVGQLAYNYDGDIYTCDEGRMLGALKDFTFKVGNVFKSRYSDIIKSPVTKMCIECSVLENQVLCYKCAFKPYCGVCPVFNYETSKTVYGNRNSSYWCDVEKGIFKILVKKLKKQENRKLFLRWFENA